MKRFLPLLLAGLLGAVFAGAAVYVALRAEVPAGAEAARGPEDGCGWCRPAGR